MSIASIRNRSVRRPRRSVATPCLVAALVAVSGALAAARAQAPAGSLIRARAAGEYVAGAARERVTSNEVVTVVAPVWGLALSPAGSVASPAYSLSASDDDTVSARFTLSSLANAPDSAAVSWRVVAGNAGAVSGMIPFRDLDGDGRPGAGETDPAFLALGPGASTPLDVALVVPPGAPAGDAWVEIAAASTADTTLAAQRTVVRVTVAPRPRGLALGPAGNPRAAPGGPGSSDDVSTRAVAAGARQAVFDNEVLNESALAEAVELVVPDSVPLPPGLSVTFADTTGAVLGPSRVAGARAVLGTLAPGASRRFRVIVSATGGATLDALLGGRALDVAVAARSLADSSLSDDTVDRLVPPPPSPGALLALDQAFRETVVTPGGVATLVVTVRNLSDSTALDRVVVRERVDAVLALRGEASLEWNVGRLAPGEARTRALKFVAGARIERGDARAVGVARGEAAGVGPVDTPPAQARVRIERDAFASDAFVTGDVFVDLDGDGVRERGEPGVADAAILLDSGEIAHADSLGRFTFPRAFAGYRVVRLDSSSLPDSLAPPEGGGPDGAARLVHLLPGGHARIAWGLRVKPPEIERVPRSLRAEERVTIRRLEHLYAAFTLPATHFGLGSARVGAGAPRALAPVVEFLLDHPGWGVFVEGHTDSIPIHTARFPSNVELSLARAAAVRDVLVALGVDSSRIVVRGLADTRPVASNRTIEGRRANRRVELAFIPPGVHIDPDLPRVGATVRDLSTLPDTARVVVRWTITTDAERPAGGRVSVRVPPRLSRARVSVELGDRPLEVRDGRARFDGLRRARPLRVRVEATCPAADTLAVDRIRAAIELRDHPAGVSEPLVLRPFAWGRSTRRATTARLLEWTVERVRARAAAAQRAVAARPTQGDAASLAPGAGARPDAPDARRASAPTEASLARDASASHRAPNARLHGRAPDAAPFDRPAGGRFGIVEPLDGALVPARDRIVVTARTPLGAEVELRVDGREVDPERIGRRTFDPGATAQTLSWYGVRLRGGWNRIVLWWRTPGGEAGADTVRVAHAAQPRTLAAEVERVRVPADGHTRATVRFAVRDGFDLAVMDGLVVDVVEGADLVETPDARPAARGHQLLTRDGVVEVTLRPSRDAARRRLVVACGDARGAVDVVFASPDRALVASGVIDVGAGIYSRHGEGSAVGLGDDGLDLDGEARVFVRGTAPGEVQVTARVDTRGGRRDPLLKDTETETTYPVYGDASRVEYAAPSQGGDYVAVERGDSWARWGDVRPGFREGEFLRYERATTGFATRLAHDGDAVRAFVARTRFATRRDEIPADGTSGFYYLSGAPIVEFSERIVLETRDRFRPERVLDARPLARNRDYTINPWDGAILFREPVPVTDAALNPVTIVVVYEVDTRGQDAWLMGARGDIERRRGGSRLRASAQAITDDRGGARYALYGGALEVGSRGASLAAELARSEDPGQDAGTAWRVRAAADGRAGRLELYHRRVDASFSNPSFRGSGHELASRKSGLEGELELGGGLRVEGDGYRHRFERTGELRESLRAALALSRGRVGTSAGVRLARTRARGDSADAVLAVAGVRLGDAARAGADVHVETNLGAGTVDDYPDRVRTRAALPLSRRAALTLTHEYLRADDRAASHQLRAGVEARGVRGLDLYTKYSLERVADDERVGALSGVRARVRLGEHARGDVGVEGLAVAGRGDGGYVVARAGLEHRVRAHHRVGVDVELRRQGDRTRALARIDGARQWTRGVGVVWNTASSIETGGGASDVRALRGTLAAVWRPDDARTGLVAAARTRYGRYAPDAPDAIRWDGVLSVDADRRLGRDVDVRLRYAFRHVEDYSHGVSARADADLVLAQALWRFAPRWDVDAWVRRLDPRGAGSRLDAGVDVGRWVDDAVRVSAGWRSASIDDNGFDAGARRAGFGVRVQVVLSEWLASRLREVSR